MTLIDFKYSLPCLFTEFYHWTIFSRQTVLPLNDAFTLVWKFLKYFNPQTGIRTLRNSAKRGQVRRLSFPSRRRGQGHVHRQTVRASHRRKTYLVRRGSPPLREARRHAQVVARYQWFCAKDLCFQLWLKFRKFSSGL